MAARPREPGGAPGGATRQPGGATRQPVGKILARDPAVPVEDSPATQPVVVADGQTTAQETFFARVRDAVGDRAHLAYSGAAGLAELLAPTVTKDAALARWCARLGVEPRDVWAFGDMPNDLPMLRWAGRSFAVANAHPDVLAAATDRTGSNDDGGVARGRLDAGAARREVHRPARASARTPHARPAARPTVGPTARPRSGDGPG